MVLAVSDALAKRVEDAVAAGRIASADALVADALDRLEETLGFWDRTDPEAVERQREILQPRVESAHAGEWNEMTLADLKKMVRKEAGLT